MASWTKHRLPHTVNTYILFPRKPFVSLCAIWKLVLRSKIPTHPDEAQSVRALFLPDFKSPLNTYVQTAPWGRPKPGGTQKFRNTEGWSMPLYPDLQLSTINIISQKTTHHRREQNTSKELMTVIRANNESHEREIGEVITYIELPRLLTTLVQDKSQVEGY
jgi:hypothetical protein